MSHHNGSLDRFGEPSEEVSTLGQSHAFDVPATPKMFTHDCNGNDVHNQDPLTESQAGSRHLVLDGTSQNTIIPSAEAEQSILVNGSKRRKRQTSPLSRMVYPRKRAIAACQLCRSRKTKCDNQRPSCSSCLRQDVRCLYQGSAFDHSSFDSASLAILDKLDHVVNLLETQNVRHKPTLATEGSQWHSAYSRDESPYRDHLAENRDTPNGILTLNRREQAVQFALDYETPVYFESAEITANYHGSCEDILEWPVFQGRYDRRDIERLIFNPQADKTSFANGAEGESTADSMKFRRFHGDVRGGRSVEEEDVVQLVQIFLTNVHTKNPVIELGDVLGMARTIAEQGFRWDAQSCLVLIACGLARLSSPFTLSARIPDSDSLSEHKDSFSDTPGYRIAEDYYLASCKRLGLLGNSIIATQCHFLHGVYEMYSMRPLQGWISFNRACITFQTLLRNRREQQRHRISSTQSLEHRLYWSCLKSEHECRIEVRLPPSGLSKFPYPDCFPSPPASSPTLTAQNVNTGQDRRFSMISINSMDVEQEKSWYYYLAEIAARRIFIRVTNYFYSTNERAWLRTPIEQTIRIAGELESQWTQWRDHIPYPVAFEKDRIASDELAFHLQARAAEVRERIYRPFLYLAIELPLNDRTQEMLAPFVQKHVTACFKLLHQWAIRFRHHGTWFGVRQMLSAGLLLLAAVKGRVMDIPEEEWRRAIRLVIAVLSYWELEAPDLKVCRMFVEDMVEGLNVRTERPHLVSGNGVP